MALRVSQKYILLILIIMAIVVIAGIIITVFKNWGVLSPIEKAKENALEQVLLDERGNPMISQDKFEQYLLVEDPQYQIIYQKSNDTFIISINNSPFEEIRKEAEENFLSLIKTDKSIACQFKVRITTPAFANPELAGKNFPLSFCK